MGAPMGSLVEVIAVGAASRFAPRVGRIAVGTSKVVRLEVGPREAGHPRPVPTGSVAPRTSLRGYEARIAVGSHPLEVAATTVGRAISSPLEVSVAALAFEATATTVRTGLGARVCMALVTSTAHARTTGRPTANGPGSCLAPSTQEADALVGNACGQVAPRPTRTPTSPEASRTGTTSARALVRRPSSESTDPAISRCDAASHALVGAPSAIVGTVPVSSAPTRRRPAVSALANEAVSVLTASPGASSRDSRPDEASLATGSVAATLVPTRSARPRLVAATSTRTVVAPGSPTEAPGSSALEVVARLPVLLGPLLLGLGLTVPPSNVASTTTSVRAASAGKVGR